MCTFLVMCMLITHARTPIPVSKVHKADPSTKIFVYRNSIKALNWFTDVREKLDDPAYSGWFIKFRDYKGQYKHTWHDAHARAHNCARHLTHAHNCARHLTHARTHSRTHARTHIYRVCFEIINPSVPEAKAASMYAGTRSIMLSYAPSLRPV